MNKEYEEKERNIINNYGLNHQLKYLQSEVFELNEAVIVYENDEYDHHEKILIDHIAEEIADVHVLLKQIQLHYKISDKQIEDIMKYKIDRQIDRIEESDKMNKKINCMKKVRTITIDGVEIQTSLNPIEISNLHQINNELEKGINRMVEFIYNLSIDKPETILNELVKDGFDDNKCNGKCHEEKRKCKQCIKEYFINERKEE